MASEQMHRYSRGTATRIRAKQQSGQSLLIALAILFLLGFLGALFSAIVIRNLKNAGTSNDTINTDYFAQSGINYANTMLLTDPLGADWRPPLQYVDTTSTASAQQLQQVSPGPGLKAVSTSDPDFRWLNAGYTRYNMNGGRFLLKLTYDPYNNGTAQSTSKFILIDSVGRVGTVSVNDPTSYTTAPPDYRRSELYAYKPIGIVDYSRFITNKENRTDTVNLGMPSVSVTAPGAPFGRVATPGVYDIDPGNLPGTDPYTPNEYPLVTTYGSPAGYINLVNPVNPIVAQQLGGGSLRSNMNVRLYGVNNAYLNSAYGDDWEIAGNLTFDGYNVTLANTSAAAYNSLPAQFSVFTQAASVTPTQILPSNDPNFITDGGVIRDGSLSPDATGFPRQIRRLNPPLIDTVDSATGLTRYQTMTGSAEVQAQQCSNTADYGPATVNVDNDSDIQHESTNQVGLAAHTLRDDWLNPGTNYTGGSWEGSFYNPPGTLITFGPLTSIPAIAPTTTTYGITITRSDIDPSGTPVQWTTGTGGAATPIGETLSLSYDSLPAGQAVNPYVDASGHAVGYLNADQPVGLTFPGRVSVPNTSIPNDIVIHATGNIRVRGVISDPNPGDPNFVPQHITIVTDGIAYIDGSILKGNPASSIAILAKQYVCVNTTQFLAGAVDLQKSVTTVSSDGASEVGPDSPPDLRFNNAELLDEQLLYDQQATGSGVYNLALYVEQSAGALSDVSQGIVNGAIPLPTASGPSVFGTTPVRDVYGFGVGNPLASLATPSPNQPYTLSFNKSTQYNGDWLLQKAAVLPGDIGIQAVLYAQDDSFFVIPGDWFNSDTTDTLTHAFARGANSPATQDSRYPFFGQPIDLKITITGAVSENIPANLSDESSWLQKWGWIPRYHGNDYNDLSPHSINVPTTGPNAGVVQVGIGLNFSYDHLAGFPYTVANKVATYLRQDRYGRPLPIAPALPVSPDLLYSGQPLAN